MSHIISILNNNKRRAAGKTNEVGQIGETLAHEYLLEQGYRPIIANFRVPIGRNRKGVAVTGEIDLIALDGDTLCFVEVKTRSSADFASPQTAVDLRKQRQITRAARVYRKIFRIQNWGVRYDVVSIILDLEPEQQIEIYKGFWSESKFRKRFWIDDF